MLLKVRIPDELFNELTKHTNEPSKLVRELIDEYVKEKKKETK